MTTIYFDGYMIEFMMDVHILRLKYEAFEK